MILRILGAILGFLIMICSVIGLFTIEESYIEYPEIPEEISQCPEEDWYAFPEISGQEPSQSIPSFIGVMAEPVVMAGQEIIAGIGRETAGREIPGAMAGIGTDTIAADAGEPFAGIGPDVFDEDAGGLVTGAGADTAVDEVSALIAGIGSDVIIPQDITEVTAGDGKDDLIVESTASDETSALMAGIGSDAVSTQEIPEITAGAGKDDEAWEEAVLDTMNGLRADIGADPIAEETDEWLLDAAAEEDMPFVITFENQYSIQVPEGLILADSEDEGSLRIAGFSENDGPALAIRSVVPAGDLTLEQLRDLCESLYGDAELNEDGEPGYVTAYDEANDTDLCFFLSPESGQVYIIGLTGLDEDHPAQEYFESLQ